jgi:hypothetical protein
MASLAASLVSLPTALADVVAYVINVTGCAG